VTGGVAGRSSAEHALRSEATGERPLSLVPLALWIGLLTGFGEVAAIGVHLLRPGFLQLSRDAVWMVPAVDGGLFVLLGLAGALIALILGRVSWPIAAGVLAGLGTVLVLLRFPQLHPLASLALGAGLGFQLARRLNGRVTAFRRLVRRSLPWLVVSPCVLGVLTVGWRSLRERRLVVARPNPDPSAPNVVLLILDTVRAADLSLYGYARRTTPELERFAERSTVFDLAFAPASWTTPSHASMFTGRWPHELDVSWRKGLGRRWPTLAETLRARGYATAAFVANGGYAGWQSGLARGFERFEDYPISLWTAVQATSFGHCCYPGVRRLLGKQLRGVPLLWRLELPKSRQPQSADRINRAFLGWVDRARPAPFFAFLNYMDAHMPYAPPDSFVNRFVSPTARPLSPEAWAEAPKLPLTPADTRPRQDTYDGAITYLDSRIGQLLRELERRGLLDNTLVVIAADHGDEFAEHGLVNHGYSLYRFSLHVPLLLSFPGRVPGGRRVASTVSLRNLAATVLELTDPHRPRALPGRSLTRFWNRGDSISDTIVASIRRLPNQPDWYPASQGDLNSVAFDGWRYIRQEGDGTEELYDFAHDVLERWNRAESAEGARMLPRYRAALDAMLAGSSTAMAN